MRTGTDGNGITTLVTFYKCPLKCRYCINEKCHDNPIVKVQNRKIEDQGYENDVGG